MLSNYFVISFNFPGRLCHASNVSEYQTITASVKPSSQLSMNIYSLENSENKNDGSLLPLGGGCVEGVGLL